MSQTKRSICCNQAEKGRVKVGLKSKIRRFSLARKLEIQTKSEFVEESNLLVLNKLERLLTVCKVKNIDDIDLSKEFYFIGKTDEEISLVCETNDVPENTIEREDGWRGFRIQGILDFSLIGILSKLSGILADNKIGIFAVSTFNTDYILVKDADFEKSLAVLLNAGYTVI